MALPLMCVILLSISITARGDDRLLLRSRLLFSDSLLSANGTVKLGFFSPQGGIATDNYLATWFNTREFIPLWIANRDTPVSSNASLLLSNQGQLQIIDRGTVAWSASASGNLSVTQAVLFDSGNLVLGDSSVVLGDDNATYAWQSFDHPADAWVPKMKMFLGSNLVAWRSRVSPASGRFVMQMLTTTEFVISRIDSPSQNFWTSGVWNNRIFTLVPQMTDNYLYTFIFNATNPPYFVWYEKNFQHSIFRLGSDGRIEVKQLDESGNSYSVWVVPDNRCSVTSLCGSGSTCSSTSSPPCICPAGSLPRNETNWSNGDWSEGCRLGSSTTPGTSSSKRSGAIAGIGAGVGASVLAIVVVGAVVIFCRRRKARKTSVGSSNGKSNGSVYNFVGGELTPFTAKQLHAATDGFKTRLGSGGFGEVFKGSIQGEAVAVKRLMRFDDKQFRAEVSTIGTVQHINLVRLRGFCAEVTLQRCLVYEFVENGSLDRTLFSSDASSPVLTWSQRFGIALGTAKGVAYLHEECRDRIIHCDIKPENILLDAEMRPKVADFGLAKLLGREFSRVITSMRGTRGYLAPEWLSNMPITPKADVFSYGMTLLEIISGRRNIDLSNARLFYPLWAAQHVRRGEFSSLPDERLNGVWDAQELRRAAMTAIWCVQDEEINRPSMKTVVQMLEGAIDLEDPSVPSSFEIWLEIKESG